MKRNRLFLAAGAMLAVTAFVAVLALGSPRSGDQPAPPANLPVVVAAQEIRLGTPLTAQMVTIVERPETEAVDTYRTVDEVVGAVVRRTVGQGQALQSRDFRSADDGDVARSLMPGLRAIAVPLDRVTAVGYLLQAGDYVDVIIALSDRDGLNPLVVPNPRSVAPQDEGAAPYVVLDEYVNNTSVKVLVQNVQVLATQDLGADQTNSVADGSPAFVAVLAVSPQQAELVRFAQLDGNVSLVLRAPGDQSAATAATSGVTLQRLVEEYGVLPPRPVLP